VLRRPRGGATWMAGPNAAGSAARPTSRASRYGHSTAKPRAPHGGPLRSLSHPTAVARRAHRDSTVRFRHRAVVLLRPHGRAAPTAPPRGGDRAPGWRDRPTVLSPWLAVLLPRQATTTAPEPLRLTSAPLRPLPLPLRPALVPLRSVPVSHRSIPVPHRPVPVPHRSTPVTHRPGSEALPPGREGPGSGPEGHRPWWVRRRSVSEGPTPGWVPHRLQWRAHRPRSERLPPPSEPLRPRSLPLRPLLLPHQPAPLIRATFRNVAPRHNRATRGLCLRARVDA
jgi:hypothetical protein